MGSCNLWSPFVATAYAASELGSKSTLFRTGIAAIADYVVQIILGFIALGTNSGVVVVVHLTNAFVLGVLVTYLISFADSADKASTHPHIITNSNRTLKDPAIFSNMLL